MDDVRVLYRLRQNFFVRLCQAHAVPFERGVKRTEIERGNRIIIFFACRIGVGGYDFYAMSLIRQVMDKIKRGYRRSVVRFAEHVADYGDIHSSSPFLSWIAIPRIPFKKRRCNNLS